jgi:hypothetical protein
MGLAGWCPRKLAIREPPRLVPDAPRTRLASALHEFRIEPRAFAGLPLTIRGTLSAGRGLGP